MSYDTIPTHLAPIIFKMPDQTKYFGKDYTIDFIRFKGSSLVLQALAADQVDVGVLAFSTFASGILNAHQPIVGIADVAQDGPSFSTIYAVRADSPVKTVKDLKGKTIGVNAIGGAVDMAARGVLRKNGLTPDKDVRIIEASFGAMEAMTKADKIQVGAFLAPFWAKAQKDGGGFRPLFRQKDAMGTTQFLFFCAKADFIKAHRAVLVKFLADYVHGIGVVHDPKNRDRVLKIMARTDQPAAGGLRRMGAVAGQGHLPRSARAGEREGPAEQYRHAGRVEDDAEGVRRRASTSTIRWSRTRSRACERAG